MKHIRNVVASLAWLLVVTAGMLGLASLGGQSGPTHYAPLRMAPVASFTPHGFPTQHVPLGTTDELHVHIERSINAGYFLATVVGNQTAGFAFHFDDLPLDLDITLVPAP